MVQGGNDDEEEEESDDEDVEEPEMADLVFDTSRTVSKPKSKTSKKSGQPPKGPETTSNKSSDKELIRFLMAERREFNAKLLEQMERQSSITSAVVTQQAQTQKTPQKTQCLREPDMGDKSLWVSGQRTI